MGQKQQLHVGFCGAGIGGVAASIALARVGVKVTILEAADQLGEIGAGIQMTPNVARLLKKWGVDKVVGNNLVQFDEVNLRRKDGKRVGYAKTARLERELGQPWWLVHRHHLHNGLVEVARREGVEILIGARVTSLEYENTTSNRVTVHTLNKTHPKHTFDLLVGSDGLNSVVRRTMFPNVTPKPPTNNCAYRAIVPYAEIQKHPDLSDLGNTLNMDIWMGPNGYIISYPISAGKDFNLVLSHHRSSPVNDVEAVPDINDLRKEYHDYDPRIQKIIGMIPEVQRWPLKVTRLQTWSSPSKNVVLMGDAAHSMVNHMAQGAATSIEDGAFLGAVLEQVVKGNMSRREAVSLYERERMPKASLKQQVSFLNGAIWMLPEGPLSEARDKACEPEVKNEPISRSPNLYSDPITVQEVYNYDVDAHAEDAINAYLAGNRVSSEVVKPTGQVDERTYCEKWMVDRTMNWFLPKSNDWRPVKKGAEPEVRTGLKNKDAKL